MPERGGQMEKGTSRFKGELGKAQDAMIKI